MAFKARDYPADWKEIRARILDRAGNCCEWCGVPNHAVGWRDRSGRFHATAGTIIHDAAGQGKLSYPEAAALVRHANENGGLGRNGERGLVIVLTIAHLKDMDPSNTDESNLAALCQKDHLEIDRPHHLAVQRRNRQAKRDRVQPRLPLSEESGVAR